MANSIHVQLADAVVAELNDANRSWTNQFTASRTWKPWYDHDDLESLQVAVVPLTIATERLGRGASKMAYEFGIAIDMQQALNVNEVNNVGGSVFKAKVDDLDKLAQDVADFYQDGHAIMTGYPVVIAEREDVFLLAELKFEGTWETLITLRILGHR